MRNNIISFFLLALFVQNSAFSQENREAYLKGYNDTNYYRYFDTLNKLTGTALQQLNHSYDCDVVFKVDTNANIIDFEIIEIPGAELPTIAKIYIRELFSSANGKWQPQVKDSKKVVSDDMVYRVGLIKKSQTMEERIKDSQKMREYFLTAASIHKRTVAVPITKWKSIGIYY